MRRHSHSLKSFTTIVLLTAAAFAQPVCAAEPDPLSYEDDKVAMRLVLRNQEQLAGFYLGREFGAAAVDKILETCFFAAIINNKSYDVLWLDLDHWQFQRGNKTIPRLKRDYWTEQWREIDLPQRHQSTFGWTLLPETRDLRRDESAGGNVAIPMQPEPFTLTARFHTGPNRQGPVKTIVFEDVTCPRNVE